MKLRLNTVSARVLILFWSLISIMLAICFLIPQLDSHLYHELNNKEIDAYRSEITNYIRTNKFERLLAIPEFTQSEKSNNIRPVLVDEDHNMIGLKEGERSLLIRFIFFSTKYNIPIKKRFDDTLISGPFPFYLNDPISSQTKKYDIYFINQVDPQREIIGFLVDHPWLVLIIIFLFTTSLLLWLIDSFTRPILALQATAQTIASGNFIINRKLEKRGVIELQQLGRSLNIMSQSLSDLLDVRQQLLSTVSHELRTPLTRLQLATGLIRRRIGDLPELKRIDAETEKLNQMIGDLLQLSRSQLQNNIKRETICLPQIWQQVLKDAEFEAQHNDVKLNIYQQIAHPEDYYVYGNQKELASALENIIRNGFKYSYSQLDIYFKIQDKQLLIQIDDDGNGLDEKELENIFTPFYRVKEIRTEQQPGIGLGLAIVKSTINLHNGEVWAEPSPLGGLRICFQIPLYEGQMTN